jgi:hypothetical protein
LLFVGGGHGFEVVGCVCGLVDLAMRYSVPTGKVIIEEMPHDCDFLRAPLGVKGCSYTRETSVVKTGVNAAGLLIDELATLGNLPEHVKSQLRVVLDSLFPNWQELHERYDKSVTAVARLDPLLSFQLRSKDFVRPVMRTLHSLMGQDSQAAAILAPCAFPHQYRKLKLSTNVV